MIIRETAEMSNTERMAARNSNSEYLNEETNKREPLSHKVNSFSEDVSEDDAKVQYPSIHCLKNMVHIVESGTDGIWNYRKWSDGTAECWGVSAVSVTCTNEEGVYFSDSKSIALPSNLFNEDPIALAACGDPWCWVSNVGASRSAVYFKVTRGNNYSNTLSTGINLCVIGKWK